MLAVVLTVVWVATAATTLLWGMDYYALPLEDRAFSPLAELFSPVGLVGHGYGIVGTALVVVGVVGYALRKRVGALARVGTLRHWLQVHIFLCTLGPWLVLLHTTFKFGGLVSIAFWSMAVVVVSGVFGRYVYVRIPKTINGRFLGLDSVAARLDEIATVLEARAGIPRSQLEGALVLPDRSARPLGVGASLALAVAEDVRGRSRLRSVRRLLRSRSVPRPLHREVLGLAREGRRLRQQALFLQPFQRLFRYWHVVHLPLAIVMFLVLGVHVTVAILFGYVWLF